MKKVIRKFFQRYGYDIYKLHAQGAIANYEKSSNIEGLTYYETPIGNYYLPKDVWGDDFMSYHMKRGLISGSNVISTANRFVKPGTTVLDLGANFGQLSLEFSKLVGESGKVYSFEAQKQVFSIFQNNIRANNASNIIPFYNAVYNKTGESLFFPEADFTAHQSLGSFSLDPNGRKGNEIKTITIDSLDIQTPVSFMKIDIQGSDLFAMQGAEATIRKHKMPIIFEFEQQFQSKFNTSFQDYVEFVEKIGYRFAEVNQTTFEIDYLILPK